jgi:hypothetical protein
MKAAMTIHQNSAATAITAGIRKSTVVVFFILTFLIMAFQNCGRASLGPVGPASLSSNANAGTNGTGANGGSIIITPADGAPTPTPIPGSTATPVPTRPTATPTATPAPTPTPSPTPVVCAASTVHFKGEIDITNPYGVCSQKSCSPKVMVDKSNWVVPQLNPGASYEVSSGPQDWYFLSEYSAARCDNSEIYGTFKVTCSATGTLNIVKVGIRYFSALPDYSKYTDHGGFNWEKGGSKCTTSSTGVVSCSEQHSCDFEVERLEVSINKI